MSDWCRPTLFITLMNRKVKTVKLLGEIEKHTLSLGFSVLNSMLISVMKMVFVFVNHTFTIAKRVYIGCFLLRISLFFKVCSAIVFLFFFFAKQNLRSSKETPALGSLTFTNMGSNVKITPFSYRENEKIPARCAIKKIPFWTICLLTLRFLL